MGGNPDVDPPFFFMKPASAILQNGEIMPYPPGTSNLHHEVELVVAMAMGGKNIPPEKVNDMIFGYAVGLDMTKRDVQNEAKKKGQPWDMAKAFDFSAPCSSITPEMYTGVVAKGKIQCKVNDTVRQEADLSDMIWGVPQIVHYLSQLVEVFPGDLIFTGTPAGRRAGRQGRQARSHDRGIGAAADRDRLSAVCAAATGVPSGRERLACGSAHPLQEPDHAHLRGLPVGGDVTARGDTLAVVLEVFVGEPEHFGVREGRAPLQSLLNVRRVEDEVLGDHPVLVRTK